MIDRFSKSCDSCIVREERKGKSVFIMKRKKYSYEPETVTEKDGTIGMFFLMLFIVHVVTWPSKWELVSVNPLLGSEREDCEVCGQASSFRVEIKALFTKEAVLCGDCMDSKEYEYIEPIPAW